MASIADFISQELSKASKNWSAKQQELKDLISDVAKLKDSLNEIKKLSRSTKMRLADKQMTLQELDLAVAKIVASLDDDE